MTIKKHVVLYNSDAAATGAWVALNPRYEATGGRTIQISMNADDSVILEGTTLEAQDVATLGTVGASDITVIKTYTGATDANDVLIGSFSFIRVRKTGENGTAKVQGML